MHVVPTAHTHLELQKVRFGKNMKFYQISKSVTVKKTKKKKKVKRQDK